MATSTPTMALGSVLVIGGCGSLGHHIVKELLADTSVSSVAVMSRNPSINLFEKVSYHKGDIVNKADVDRIVDLVKPNVIINTASPIAYIDHEHAPEYFTVNVEGNKHLLAAAKRTGTTKAYVYTSSGPIIAGGGAAYDHADETVPTLAVSKKGDPYHVAKALGDELVLGANDRSGMRTATIRPTAMYGEGDRQMIGNTIDVMKRGETNVWLGDNTCWMDLVYVGNCARAHVLAARGLLAGITDPNAPKVDGEAFNITDDNPQHPWTFFRRIWTEAGDKTPMSKVWMLPMWLVLVMTYIAEYWVWIFSLGKKRPKVLVLERIEFVLYTRTYNIQKARDRLGYKPWVEMSEAVRRAVEWYMKESQSTVQMGIKTD